MLPFFVLSNNIETIFPKIRKLSMSNSLNVKITLYLYIVMVLASCHLGQKVKTEGSHTTSPKLEVLGGDIEGKVGCGCLFSKDENDFNESKYIYAEHNSNLSAYIKINNKILEIPLSSKSKSDYKVKLIVKSTEKTSDDHIRQSGILQVTTPDGQMIIQSFYGECYVGEEDCGC